MNPAWYALWIFGAPADSAVERIPHDFALQGGLRTVSLALQSHDDDTRFVPNNPLRLALGFSWKAVSMGGSVSLPFANEPGRLRTDAFDVQLHRYARWWVSDLFLQRYRGFERRPEAGERSDDPSLAAFQAGAVVLRVVAGNRISYRAAFRHDQRQLRSGGSVLLGGGLSWAGARSDSTPVVDSLKRVSWLQLGPVAGYAWNWVPARGWLVHTSASGGLYLGNRGFGEDFLGDGLSLQPSLQVRLSSSREFGDWSWGASLLGGVVSMGAEASGLQVQTVRADLYAVRRFHLGD